MKTLVALVGMKHRGTEALVASLPDGEVLTLIREPTNRFDSNAIQVWARDQHVGYVKASQAPPIAMAMDQRLVKGPWPVPRGATLRVTADRWPMVEIEE